MSLLATLQSSDPIHIFYSVGALFDLNTGSYIKGEKGDWILCGGLAHITGITGPGNSYKSTILHFFILTVLERYKEATGAEYDTEGTLTLTRLQQLAAECAPELIENGTLLDISKFVLTDITKYDGTQFWEIIKAMLKAREAGKEKKIKTPFMNPVTKQPIEVYAPFVCGIDSYSLFQAKNVLLMQDNNEIGDSGRNMEYMRDGQAKTQMLMEMPSLASNTGTYFGLTAHLGERPQLDPRSPLRKQLSFLKANLKLKNVPEKFMFLTNNLWYSEFAGPILNDTTKGPEWPRNSSDSNKGDTDLMTIRLINLRPKSGPAGIPFEIVASQRDGILRDLTHFHYIKRQNKDYGINGNTQNYELALFPGVALKRTNIRSKLAENPQLCRALEITSEMCQYFNLNPDIDSTLFCTPQELYDDIIKMGYSWERLLNTRSYWTFNHYTNPLRPLSTLDLLNMRAGLYRPWWYDDAT